MSWPTRDDTMLLRNERRRGRARLAALVGVFAFGLAFWAWLLWALLAGGS